jgi:hypothetical protein
MKALRSGMKALESTADALQSMYGPLIAFKKSETLFPKGTVTSSTNSRAAAPGKAKNIGQKAKRAVDAKGKNQGK